MCYLAGVEDAFRSRHNQPLRPRGTVIGNAKASPRRNGEEGTRNLPFQGVNETRCECGTFFLPPRISLASRPRLRGTRPRLAAPSRSPSRAPSRARPVQRSPRTAPAPYRIRVWRTVRQSVRQAVRRTCRCALVHDTERVACACVVRRRSGLSCVAVAGCRALRIWRGSVSAATWYT